MSDILNIVQAISNIAAKSYDGAQDERFTDDPKEVGLKREKGDSMVDYRIIDNYYVKFMGNKLGIIYQSEMRLDDAYDKNFENEVEKMIANVASFLKKEYAKSEKRPLNLQPIKQEFIVDIQHVSMVRTTVRAQKWYIIKNIKEEIPEQKLDSAIKNWLSFGKRG